MKPQDKMKGQYMNNARESKQIQKITKQYDTNLEPYGYASDKF